MIANIVDPLLMNFRRLLLALPFALCTGCATIYDYVQDHAQAQCASSSNNPQDRRTCEKQNAPAYDDYQARRKRLQEGNKPG